MGNYIFISKDKKLTSFLENNLNCLIVNLEYEKHRQTPFVNDKPMLFLKIGQFC